MRTSTPRLQTRNVAEAVSGFVVYHLGHVYPAIPDPVTLMKFLLAIVLLLPVLLVAARSQRARRGTRAHGGKLSSTDPRDQWLRSADNVRLLSEEQLRAYEETGQTPSPRD
ncbi:MAG: hypothetical protein AAB353_02250 [Candidatus Hydrogenedentota bacterium]